ncbi:MAG TPA: trypsin-like peptidase domain-containing protein [Anaerolineae bacterium]
MNRKIFVLMLVAVVLLITGAYAVSALPSAVAYASGQPSAAALQPAPLAAPKLGTVTDWETTLEGIYTRVNPSVVLINVVDGPQPGAPNSPAPGFGFGPQQGPQSQGGLGSGFVWDTAGHIVTNNHVIDGATDISVTFSDGTTAAAKVVGADPASDLAVIQVDVPAAALHPVQLGDSTKVQVGQFAVAIGNPFGEQNTMTTGIISALARSLPANDAAAQGASYTIPDVIQTDAPINPGNSGGVLLNADGQVIGVTAAIESPGGSSAGIGFAIPAAIVQKEIPSLIQTGHYTHPYIGIAGGTLTSSLAQAMGLKAGQRGAIVGSVAPGGPAAKAGLRGGQQQTTVNGEAATVGGDVITAIDGQPVKSFDDVVSYLARSTRINQTITLTILRDGKEQTVQVTLLARPDATSALQDSGNLG